MEWRGWVTVTVVCLFLIGAAFMGWLSWWRM